MCSAPTAGFNARNWDIDSGASWHEDAHIDGAGLMATVENLTFRDKDWVLVWVRHLKSWHFSIGLFADLQPCGGACCKLKVEPLRWHINGVHGRAESGDWAANCCLLENGD
jgi:hypothetical protein